MNFYLPTDEKIRILGRTVKQDPLPLFWTGSGVEFMINGTELCFVLTADHDLYEEWIRVELDGETMIRMPLNKGENRVTIYRGLNPEEVRHVQLFKEVQAMPGDPEAMLLLNRIETDGTLQALPERDLKIEFIGDSLTSGEGLAGARQLMDWQSLVFSTKESYTQIVAKELNAEIRVLSQSGWGVFKSWDAKRECALPPYYEKVCGVLQGERNAKLGAQEKNDFNAWQPDYIYVNLGSNDQNEAVEPLTEELKAEIGETIYHFLKLLRKCNPDARILYCCGQGPNKLKETSKNAVSRYIDDFSDEKVRFMELPYREIIPEDHPEFLSEFMGSRNHPGPKANHIHAESIIKEIREW